MTRGSKMDDDALYWIKMQFITFLRAKYDTAHIVVIVTINNDVLACILILYRMSKYFTTTASRFVVYNFPVSWRTSLLRKGAKGGDHQLNEY